jgi:DNA polymerase I-like protein with 3'-5' exonuclease and polymerase domains
MGVRIAHKHVGLNADGSLTNRDTMSEAFLLGGYHPKGLKPLSWRLCGMEMDSYEDLVGPTELVIVTGYLQSAFERLKCSICNGGGRVTKFGVRMIGRSDCGVCGGSGRVGIGKSGKPLKNPRPCDCRFEETYQLKTDEKCGYCVDGLLVPLPDREFVFDADKADWRWKQPQSIARWIKRRINARTEIDSSQAEGRGDDSITEDADSDDEPAAHYFKPRRDWNDLRGRADRSYVEVICGPLPRTTLSDVPDQDRVTIYAARDADATLRVSRKLDPLIRSLGLAQIREMDASFLPYLSRMEQSGMPINRPHFELLRDHLDSRMQEVRDRLSLTVGERMNPNGEGIADLLFNQLGLPTMKLTTSGSRESIDDDVLGALKAQLRKRGESDGQARLSLSVLDCVTDYREVQKQKSGYADPILDFSDRFDVIRTTYNYTSAATGRLSSSDPINAQTFPNPDNYPADLNRLLNYGIQIRSGIVAGRGYKLIGSDFSQIEMVVGAHITQDAGMLKVFRDGLDLHYYAASMMFDIPYDKVSRQLRTQTKPLSFGAFYGLTAPGLQAQFASLPNGSIEKTEAECQELIDRYYAAFPGVLEWKERLWQQAEIDGCVRDLFGRLRLTPGLRSNIKRVRSAAEREAANMPIQSTANGIIRIASRLLWERTLPLLWAEQIDIQPMMQTHDENVMRCQEDAAEYSAVMIAGTMQGAVRLSVPIRCEPKIGDNLYEIK